MYFKNKLQQNRLKGVTLVEVTISLALIAIAAAMIASFCALTVVNVKVYNTYDKLRKEESLIDDVTSSWVNSFDSFNYTFSVGAENTLTANDGTNNFNLSFTDKTLSLNYDNDSGAVSYSFEQIDALKITLTKNDDVNGSLIKFEFHYLLQDEEGTFVIYKIKRSIDGGKS